MRIVKEEDCADHVAKVWSYNRGSPIHQLLGNCGQKLKKWSATKRKFSRQDINFKFEKLLDDHSMQGEIKQLHRELGV